MITNKKLSAGQLEIITGGKQYTDTTSTIIVTEGNSSNVSTSISSTVDINMPSDFTEMWDDTTNKLIAVNNKDYFVTEFRFKASSSVASGRMAIKLDIGGALGTIIRQTINLHKVANTVEQHSIQLCYFTGTTFISNGGTLILEALEGTITLTEIVIIPFRVHKGR